MGTLDNFRQTNIGPIEQDLDHTSTGGHTHDGKNSSPVHLQPGQVKLEHLHRDTVRYLTMPDQTLKHMPFTLAGPLIASTSPPYSPMRPTFLVGFQANFGTAGTTNTRISVRVNSNPINAFVVDVQNIVTQPWATTSSDGTQFFSPFMDNYPNPPTGISIVYPLGPQDKVQVRVVTPGTNSADLVAILLFNDSSSILI